MKRITIGEGLDPVAATTLPESLSVVNLIEISIGIGVPIISVGKGWEIF